MNRITKWVLSALSAFMLIFVLAACEHPAPPPGPNSSCPAGWTRISTQSWWQKANVLDITAIPQELPASGVGGHLHVEGCLPLNVRVDQATIPLTANIRTHQGFTGEGYQLDVGDGYNGGTSVVAKPVNWDSKCPKTSAGANVNCSTTVVIDVPVSALLDDGKTPNDGNPRTPGPRLIRMRYMNVDHPDNLPLATDERQFASNEIPFSYQANPDPNCTKAVEGKGWYRTTDGNPNIDYARAGFNGCFNSSTPLSGTIVFNQRFESSEYPITLVRAHVDARFGMDDFSGVIPGSSYGPSQSSTPNQGVGTSSNRNVTLDTTQYTDGWHCLSVQTQVKDPHSPAVNTGVLEYPILIANGNGATVANGRGSCFDT